MNPDIHIKHLFRENRILAALLHAVCIPPLVRKIISVCEDLSDNEMPMEKGQTPLGAVYCRALSLLSPSISGYPPTVDNPAAFLLANQLLEYCFSVLHKTNQLPFMGK